MTTSDEEREALAAVPHDLLADGWPTPGIDLGSGDEPSWVANRHGAAPCSPPRSAGLSACRGTSRDFG